MRGAASRSLSQTGAFAPTATGDYSALAITWASALEWSGVTLVMLAKLRHPDVQVQLPVRARELAVFEKEELDLPEARVVDLERVGPGPVLALG